MSDNDALDMEARDLYRRKHISMVSDNANDPIYKLIVEDKYGPGARDPQMVVDWPRFYEENQCPSCSDTISLENDAYICKKCGLSIPLRLYDKGLEEHKRLMRILSEEKAIKERLKAAGYDERRVSLLKKAGSDDAASELAEKAKHAQQALAHTKAWEPGRRRGITLTGKRREDAPK